MSLTKTEGTQYSRASPLLKTYACARTSNVTIFLTDLNVAEVPAISVNLDLLDILKLVENPCRTVNYFSPVLRKLVLWKGDDDEMKTIHDYYNQFIKMENVREFHSMQKNVIEDLHKESCYDDNLAKDDLKQCIVLMISNTFDDNLQRLLQSLQKETQWKVVISCVSYFCPVIKGIPVNQVVPLQHGNLQKSLHFLRAVIRNPTFDRLSFFKYSKFDHVNLSCMFNKTVIVNGMEITMDLLEKAVQITSNTQDLTSKIVFGGTYNQEFWKHFMKMGGLKNTNVSIVFDEDSYELPLKANGVFLTNFLPHVKVFSFSLMFTDLKRHFMKHKGNVPRNLNNFPSKEYRLSIVIHHTTEGKNSLMM